MFTGIIQGMGSIRQLTGRGADAFLEIETPLSLDDMKIGDSIAVNGACLTVTAKAAKGFSADVSAETLAKTNLRTLKTGDKVNLEMALRMNDFLGGHIVLGHVDTVGLLATRTAKSNSIIFGIDLDEAYMRYVVQKGSIAVDGISLTVNECEKKRFYVNMIPVTAKSTTLGFKKIADPVNIETDILGKYVEKLLAASKSGAGGIDMDFLARHGYTK
jgi:riboflavin synthase